MKLKFKKQAYQTNAVEAVAGCFAGQPKRERLNYRVDPGRAVDATGQAVAALETVGFKNADLAVLVRTEVVREIVERRLRGFYKSINVVGMLKILSEIRLFSGVKPSSIIFHSWCLR